MSTDKRKEEATRRTIIAVHNGLANIYNHRLYQYVRPELCIKLETFTEKYGKMEYYIQLLGYYYNTLPGLVIYENYDDFLSMIYKEQTIDNLAAGKKAQYIVFLPKNYKSNDPLNGIDNTSDNTTKNINGGLMSRNKLRDDGSNNSPYQDPKSRVSATHWNMIKEYNICAMNSMNPKLPMIPCFTPRLEKLSDPQKTLHSLIWISYSLYYLFVDYENNDNKPLTYIDIDNNGKWKYIKNKKLSMSEIGGYKFKLQENVLLTFPFGINENKYDLNKLSLRPWNTTLPYIFNTMKTCGDGLKYFNKKLSEAKNKIILRKINNDNYLNDPSGIDYVTAIKGLVGVYMKIATLNNINNIYDNKCINNLDEALKHDQRDTLKCRALKLKCLLYSYKYKQYLNELKKEKFYDEKKLHRIDSTLSWNVTFCYFKLFGAKNPKTIESIKKSIQNHENILYVLIGIKASNCSNPRNQRDLNRHLNYYFDYGQFWLSDSNIFKFIINDVLYYYLDSKSRPITTFIFSQNRPFTINKTPVLNEPKCINTSCPNKSKVLSINDLIQCKICHTTYFCSIQCQNICKDKKHSIQCEMIKKTKRIYKHYMDKVFKNTNNNNDNDKNNDETKINDINNNIHDIYEEEEEEDDDDDNDNDPNPFIWGDSQEDSLKDFMKQLESDGLTGLPTSSIMDDSKEKEKQKPKHKEKPKRKRNKLRDQPRRQRKSVEEVNYDPKKLKNRTKSKKKSKDKDKDTDTSNGKVGKKRRGSIELDS